MGILKFMSECLREASKTNRYVVTCKYCGRTEIASTLQGAIQFLQTYDAGCGRNCHEPVITQQP
ncbi:MAG: hypothetical protein SPK10_07795 [Treponema sp.]|nr:hypothetical protein [Treponema sp.]